MRGIVRTLHPTRVIVRRISCRWVGGMRQLDTVRPREAPEVVVKGMVLFDDDNHVLDRRCHGYLLVCESRSAWCGPDDRLRLPTQARPVAAPRPFIVPPTDERQSNVQVGVSVDSHE